MTTEINWIFWVWEACFWIALYIVARVYYKYLEKKFFEERAFMEDVHASTETGLRSMEVHMSTLYKHFEKRCDAMENHLKEISQNTMGMNMRITVLEARMEERAARAAPAYPIVPLNPPRRRAKRRARRPKKEPG